MNCGFCELNWIAWWIVSDPFNINQLSLPDCRSGENERDCQAAKIRRKVVLPGAR